jgi:hypothetical protein
MFRMLVLQSLYKLSDEQVEYQVRDRPSFARFLRLGLEDSPDGTTLWCSGVVLRIDLVAADIPILGDWVQLQASAAQSCSKRN